MAKKKPQAKQREKVVPISRYEAGRPSPYHQNPPMSSSPDDEYSISGRTLREWARHLADNSSIVSAVLSSRVSNAIGPGLTYEPLVKDRNGELIPEINDTLRRLHTDWSASADVTGELTRGEVERLAWRTWDLDGECFIRRVYRDDGYKVDILPTEWIPGSLTEGTTGSNYIVHGVEKDEWRRPVAYYVEPNYDASYGWPERPANRMTRVPAADMYHLKRVQYPNQTRGVTLIHAIIFRIADIAEYSKSHRLAARASADLFASINRAPDMDTDDIDDDRTWVFDRLQILDKLAPGESVNFHTPQNPNQNAVDFVREELRAIASGCDVGFSQIAQVFDSSYAAQRLEVVDTWRKVERDRSKFITDFAKPALYNELVRLASLRRLLPARAMRRADPLTLFDVRIDGPTMPVIDPVKDRQAFELDQTNQWDSRPGIIRRMGKVPAQVDAEIESDDLGNQTNDEPVPDQSPEE